MRKLLVVFPKEIDEKVSGYFQSTLGKSVSFASFRDVCFILSKTKSFVLFNALNVKSFDLVYFRGLRSNIPLYQAVLGLYPDLPLLQTIKTGNTTNKLFQYCCFAREGLAFAKSILFPLNAAKSSQAVSLLKKELGFPVVAKHIFGDHGADCFLFKDEKELGGFITKHDGSIEFLFQGFVPNDYDLRITVVGEIIGAVIKRTRIQKREWRNNTSLGARREMLKVSGVDSEILQLAIKAKNAVGYSLGGVDIVINKDNNKPYILEVNSAPEFKPGTAEAVVAYSSKHCLLKP
ncbi:MAG: ATP-grasp domain-containing protein [Patescibacteria group bacterium]|jgi:hypothetical protein